MKALDELRSCFERFALFNPATAESVLNERADAIEKELEERYIELPLDMDGVPIHVGDTMMDLNTPRAVMAVTGGSIVMGGYPCSGEQMFRFGTASNYRHYHKPTIEDTLREFAIACENAGNAGDAVNRLISEYAAKLQLKEE